MATHASTTSPLRDVNTPSRRRFLGGLALGATVTLAPVAAVLAPDPDWSASVADLDAELIALCRAETANCRRFNDLSSETAHLRFPQPEPVRDEFATLVDRTWRAREAISAIPAHSLVGVRAKAEALRADWTPGLHGDARPAWRRAGDRRQPAGRPVAAAAGGGVGMSARHLPLPADALGATVARLRAMAAESGDRLYLSDGPVNSDWRLLDLCADAAHQRQVADAALAAWRACPGRPREPAFLAAREAERTAKAKLLQLLRAIGKMPATTPAGLYAKALAVQSSATGASILARSLAQDFLDCRELRASLWPAEAAE